MSRFVGPGGVRTLALANGDTLTVRRRLNAAQSRVMKGMQTFPTLADPAVVMAYLVDWSLRGDDGALVNIVDLPPPDLANVLDALDEDDFDEIYAAVSAHRAAMVAERADAKKALGGTPVSAAISPSPSDADGASSGSAN